MNPTMEKYQKLVKHIGDTMGLPKGVKERKPVHDIIKKIKAEVEAKKGQLPSIEAYEEVKKMFDANPNKYK